MSLQITKVKTTFRVKENRNELIVEIKEPAIEFNILRIQVDDEEFVNRTIQYFNNAYQLNQKP